MKNKLFALYDKIAEQYGPVFQAVNINTAVRTVQNMKIKQYDDFELHMIGEWDMEAGILGVNPNRDTNRIIEWVTPTYLNEVKAELKLLGGGK